MTRITIILSDEERRELFKVSQRELRPLPDQARFILRAVLLGNQPTLTNDKPATDLVSQAETVNGSVNGQPT